MLARAGGLGLLLVGLPLACTGSRVETGLDSEPVPMSRETKADLGPAFQIEDLAGEGLSPLDPRDSREDRVLATAGTLTLRAHHLVDRLIERDPAQVQSLIELLLLDERVRQLAAEYEVEVPASDVRLAVRRDWARTKRILMRDGVPEDRLEEQLRLKHGLTIAQYRKRSERQAWRRLLRAYTLRYFLRRRGSIRLLYYLNEDRDQTIEARGKVAHGADLRVLARKESKAASAARGGELPRYPLDFRHPALDLAKGLHTGDVSRVRELDAPSGRKSYAFVQVLDIVAPDRRSFAEQRGEISFELDRRPVQGSELEILLSGR